MLISSKQKQAQVFLSHTLRQHFLLLSVCPTHHIHHVLVCVPSFSDSSCNLQSGVTSTPMLSSLVLMICHSRWRRSCVSRSTYSASPTALRWEIFQVQVVERNGLDGLLRSEKILQGGASMTAIFPCRTFRIWEIDDGHVSYASTNKKATVIYPEPNWQRCCCCAVFLCRVVLCFLCCAVLFFS